MPRLFIGLEPPPAFRDALALLQNRLRDAGVTGRCLDPANFHLTLAFIGMWPEKGVPPLPRVRQPFPLTLSRPGIFPEARVLWAGTGPSAELDQLADHVRQVLSENGVPYDPKPFSPHFTLVRKPIIPDGMLLREIAVPEASMTVREVCLYRSDHTELGMAYTVIGRSEA